MEKGHQTKDESGPGSSGFGKTKGKVLLLFSCWFIFPLPVNQAEHVSVTLARDIARLS